MSDDQSVEADEATQDPAADEEPFRRDVNPADRFAVGGKPLPMEELIVSTMGELYGRPHADPRPQPPPQPFAVIWRARRPAPNPAEADWAPPEPEEGEQIRSENETSDSH